MVAWVHQVARTLSDVVQDKEGFQHAHHAFYLQVTVLEVLYDLRPTRQQEVVGNLQQVAAHTKSTLVVASSGQMTHGLGSYQICRIHPVAIEQISQSP